MNVTMTPILLALGGRWGWRFWWPAVPFLVDAAMVMAFRKDNLGELAGVLLLTSLFSVLVLWLWGARFAISVGHARRHVYPVGVLASFVSVVLWGGVTGVSALLTSNVQLHASVPLFVFYGMPLASLALMLCTLALGHGWRGVVLAVLSWALLAAGFYGFVWPWLEELTGNQFVGGMVGIAAFFAVACWLGWVGFRYARA